MPPVPFVELGEGGSIVIHLRQPADFDQMNHARMLAQALQVYQDRNSGQRKGVWMRSGVRGQIVHVFAKAERAFQAAFGAREIPDPDHLVDLINYAVFALRLCVEGDRNVTKTNEEVLGGAWPW